MSRLVFGLLLAALAASHPVAAKTAIRPATVVSAFDFQNRVRFCYDQRPEYIYLHNADNGRTAVVARSLDGQTRTLFELPGFGDDNSLSCSTDGSTIAVLDMHQDYMFIFRAAQVSIYKFDRDLFYSVRGESSLLSPDGSTVSAPGDPTHVSGPDVLKQMRFLRTDRLQDAWFAGDGAYVSNEHSIDVYQNGDEGWKKQRSVSLPADFGVNEISRCGDRILVSLGDDEKTRFITLDEPPKGRDDWLAKMGVTDLLRKFKSFVKVHGAYGRCVFALVGKRDIRNVLLGIVIFDGERMQRFSIAPRPLAISGDEISLSKDGCYALVTAFKRVYDVPEFTFPQQAVLLKLPAPGCN
jgi:hypothetical protein